MHHYGAYCSVSKFKSGTKTAAISIDFAGIYFHPVDFVNI